MSDELAVQMSLLSLTRERMTDSGRVHSWLLWVCSRRVDLELKNMLTVGRHYDYRDSLRTH